MSSADDSWTTATAASNPVKFPMGPYASAASYFDAYAEEMARAAKSVEPGTLELAAAGDRSRLTSRCPHLLVRQRRVGVDREPYAM